MEGEREKGVTRASSLCMYHVQVGPVMFPDLPVYGMGMRLRSRGCWFFMVH